MHFCYKISRIPFLPVFLVNDYADACKQQHTGQHPPQLGEIKEQIGQHIESCGKGNILHPQVLEAPYLTPKVG